MHRALVLWIALAPWSLSLASCGSDEPQIALRICGDLAAPEVDAIQVLVTDTRGVQRLTALAAMAEGPEGIELPVDAEIPRLDGPGFVSAEARSDGLLVGRFTVRVPDLATQDMLTFPLTTECLMFDCPMGQTCIDGDCTMAPLPDRGPSCP
ncbi:MAG: hypothetical protein AAGE52_10450 [Myxococcota bacterium]